MAFPTKDAAAHDNDRLTPEEDSALRRWQYFHNLGFTLSEPVEELRAAIRARDKRIEIREPRDTIEPTEQPARPAHNRAGRSLH